MTAHLLSTTGGISEAQDLVVLGGGLTALERGFAGRAELVASLRERGRRHAELAGECVDRLATEEALLEGQRSA